MARRTEAVQAKKVDEGLLAGALAKAICDGDIVNFRLLFAPFSPGRVESTEAFESEKYAYLLPDEETQSTARYRKALEAVQRSETWRHIEKELGAQRPPRLPWELVLELADNAVREGKFTSAAQAYELLRVRRRTQEEFYVHADAALDADDVALAVRGYRIATGLAYDYAAFPEPLPQTTNYQTKALMLHGKYPTRPEDCIALQDVETHVTTALEYLLNDSEAAARLQSRPMETRLAVLQELVRQIDPAWEDFVDRYKEACALVVEFGERLRKTSEDAGAASSDVREEVAEQMGDDPMAVTQLLLGREIEGGEWWQYLKEIAYEHPAGILFIARQAIGDQEILVPRLRGGSPVADRVGIQAPAVALGPEEGASPT